MTLDPRLLEAYLESYPEESAKVSCFLQFLEHATHNPEGNIHQCTGSSWLTNPEDGRILLTHHKKLNRWLQLGGHMEDVDEGKVANTALREAQEESGIMGLKPLSHHIFHLGIHYIPHSERAKDHSLWLQPDGSLSNAHFHFDVCFLHHTDHNNARNIKPSHESHDLRWFSLPEILTMNEQDSELSSMAKKWQVAMHLMHEAVEA